MRIKEKLFDSVRNPTLLLLILLTVAGALLRLHALGAQSVWFDEAISGIAARGFLENGFPVLPSGHHYTRAFLHTGLVALSYASLGFGELAGRLPAALFGILSIPLAFLVGRRMKNRRVGLILAFLIAFSTVQIAWSRQIRFYQQLQFFFLLSLYFLERLLDRTSWRNLFLFSISVGCMTVSHDAFGYLLAVPLALWFFLEKFGWLRDKIHKIRQMDRRDGFGVAVLIAVLAMVALFKGPEFLASASRALGNRVDYLPDYLLHFEVEMGGFFLLAIPGALLGVVGRGRNLLYILAFLLPFYVISSHIIAMQHRYVFVLFPLLFAFSAIALDYAHDRLRGIIGDLSEGRDLAETVLPIISVVVLIGIIASAANFTFEPGSRYDLGYTAPQGEFEPAYEYIEDNWEENDVVISTLPPVTWYYLRRCDYWISFSYWGLDEVPKEEVYTGAGIIRGVEDIREVARENKGWVVMDSMGKGGIDREILSYVRENFTQVTEAGGRGVWVYKWS